MKRILAALAFMVAIASASAQTTYNVALAWTPPATCTAAPAPTTLGPCTYQIYRLPTACPATLSVTTQPWVALPPTASQATSATDTSVSTGSTLCYFMETVSTPLGNISSAPGAMVQVVVPAAGPPPPTGVTATVVTITVTVQ